MLMGYEGFLMEPRVIEEMKCKICGSVCNLDSKNWRGTNWLGEEIMNVRDGLNQLGKAIENNHQIKWDSM